MVRCLLEEAGADLNIANHEGIAPYWIAASNARLDVMRYLVKELGADINQGRHNGATALYVAAQRGHLAVVRCMVTELGADVNLATHNGSTPLMIASAGKHMDVVKYLIKAGADPQVTSMWGTTAEDHSNKCGASMEQTAYLKAKTHCSNSSCSGAGLLKCTGCRQARYCGEPCQFAHWKAHKADCKLWSAELKASTERIQT
jgi:ankyrin repeat protein